MSVFFHRSTPISGAASLASLLLVAALGACGGDTSPPPNGNQNPLEPDPEYFGLQDGLCYRYDVGGGNLWFTLEVREDDGIAVKDVKTWELTWRDNTGERRTDWVEVTGDGELLLHRRRLPQQAVGTVNDRYEPPPVLLRETMTGNIQSHTTSRRVVVTQRSDADLVFQTVYRGQETIEVLGETQEARVVEFLVVDPDLEGFSEKARFVPNLGFATVEPGDSTWGEVTLGEVAELEDSETCGVQ